MSRILNGDATFKVAEPTRARVLAAVAELGYRPNAIARGLRMSQTSAIGFVLPDVTNPVYGPIVQGAQARAAQVDYVILLGSGIDAESTKASFARLLDEGRVDGLLIASATLEDDIIRRVAAGRSPVVVVNRRVDGVPGSVIVDDEGGSLLATEHLLALGHRRLGHVAGPAHLDTTIRRRAGFDRAINAAGVDGIVISTAEWDAAAGYAAALQLLDGHPELTAIFAANVMAAIGVLRAAHERGRQIPSDLSVVALHDLPLAAFTEPPLTTVAMPLYELGSTAVEVLLERIQGGAVRDIVVDIAPQLMERGSTARVAS